MADKKDANANTDLRERFMQLVEESKRFTENLLKENEQLRLKLAAYQSDKDANALREEVEHLRRMLRDTEEEKNRLLEELTSLKETLRSVEEENRFYANKYVEIEKRNSDLATLYVTSYRLHSALEPVEVLKIILEIVVSMVGAESFGVYIYDNKKKHLCLVAYENLANQELFTLDSSLPHFEDAFNTGKTWVAKEGISYNTSDKFAPMAIVPLKVANEVVGAIVIYELLIQKRSFEPLDFELFEFLAGQAARALLSAALYSKHGLPSALLKDLCKKPITTGL